MGLRVALVVVDGLRPRPIASAIHCGVDGFDRWMPAGVTAVIRAHFGIGGAVFHSYSAIMVTIIATMAMVKRMPSATVLMVIPFVS